MATKDTGIVNIHGKEYSTVAKRVQDFRKKFPGYNKDLGKSTSHSIVTELVERTETDVVMKASIIFDGEIVATGYAEENRSATSINKTSALEVAETSAIGRALAAFGMAGTEYASADEVANAIGQQNAPAKPAEKPVDVLSRSKATINDELEAQGYSTAVAKKAFITKVLGQSTIDNLDHADAVMDQLENEKDAA